MVPLLVTPEIDAYRREQAALGGRVAAVASALVRERMNPAEPDRGWARLLAQLIQLIRGGRSVSEELAMQFYHYLRELEEFSEPPPEPPQSDFPVGPVTAGLIWTGPRLAKSIRQREPMVTDRELVARVGAAVGRSAMRQALNGGREVTRRAMLEDPAAWGWARVTDADPCEFCRMLAERGPVYKSARSAGAFRQWHDGCACQVVVVFRPPRRVGGRSRSRRGPDGLTDRQRAVIERVRREIHGE